MYKLGIILSVLLVMSKDGCRKEQNCKPCNAPYSISRIYIEKQGKPFAGSVAETDSAYLVTVIQKRDTTCCPNSLRYSMIFSTDSCAPVRYSMNINEHNTCNNKICIRQYINSRSICSKNSIVNVTCLIEGSESKETLSFNYKPFKKGANGKDTSSLQSTLENYGNRAFVNGMDVSSPETNEIKVGNTYNVEVDWNYFLADGQQGFIEVVVSPSFVTRQYVSFKDTIIKHTVIHNSQIPSDKFSFTIIKKPEFNLTFCAYVKCTFNKAVFYSNKICDGVSAKVHKQH